MILNLFLKFQMRHEGFHCMASDSQMRGLTPDLRYNFLRTYNSNYEFISILFNFLSTTEFLGG